MICVDIGSDITKSAVYEPNSQKKYNAKNITKINTSFLIHSNGNILHGTNADKNLKLSNSQLYIKDFKSKLGSTQHLILHNQKQLRLSALDITSKFLKSIRDDYQKSGCKLSDINSIMLTIPADFTPAQQSELKKAAELAGFGTVHIIPEATAICAYYIDINPQISKHNNILTIDWGASSFKLSVITKVPDSQNEYISRFNKVINSFGGNSFCDELTNKFMNSVNMNNKKLCSDLDLCILLSQNLHQAQQELSKTNMVNIKLPSYPNSPILSAATIKKLIDEKSDTIKQEIYHFIEDIHTDYRPEIALISGGFFVNIPAQQCISYALQKIEIYKHTRVFSDVIVAGILQYVHTNYNNGTIKMV